MRKKLLINYDYNSFKKTISVDGDKGNNQASAVTVSANIDSANPTGQNTAATNIIQPGTDSIK